MILLEYEALVQYIRPELVIVTIVLYFIGNALRQCPYVKNELIPFVLGIISIFICAIYILAVDPVEGGYQQVLIAIFSIIIQGVCCAAASVYGDQLVKQSLKLKSENVEKTPHTGGVNGDSL